MKAYSVIYYMAATDKGAYTSPLIIAKDVADCERVFRQLVPNVLRVRSITFIAEDVVLSDSLEYSTAPKCVDTRTGEEV